MDNLENENPINNELESNNTEKATTSNRKKISWLNIAYDVFTTLIGANMAGNMMILANNYNIDELPTPSKISIYVGGVTSILMGTWIVCKSGDHFWRHLETKLYGSNSEEDIVQIPEDKKVISKKKTK
ncbi:MAG: hypothetical protein HFI87_05650 [Bacilli bacterium]|nr:hypothetical protein [Bacilli bacterium]